MTKYDDASWHFESTPEGDDSTRWDMAAAHIGAYVKWCLLKGWVGELDPGGELDSEVIQSMRYGGKTGTEFLMEHWDGCFFDELLNTEGNAFSNEYYESNTYFGDLERVAGIQALTVPESEYDLDRLYKILDKRYSMWLARTQTRRASSTAVEESPSKPWWKFW